MNRSLGRFGMAVNVVALAYCIYLVTFLCFPLTQPVTVGTFNWASAVFVVVALISLVYYMLEGRKVYKGPSAYVRKVE